MAAINQQRLPLARDLLGPPRSNTGSNGSPQPVYPNNIPRELFEILKMVSLQIIEEIVEQLLGINLRDEENFPSWTDIQDWWYQAPDYSWDTMSQGEIESVMVEALEQWFELEAAFVFGVMSDVDVYPEEMNPENLNTFIDFWNERCSGLDSRGLRNDPRSRFVRAWSCLLASAKLVNDFLYCGNFREEPEDLDDPEGAEILNGPVLDLRSFMEQPTRNIKLEQIALSAPPLQNLTEATTRLIASLPEHRRMCGICQWDFEPWVAPAQYVGLGGRWLGLSPDRRRLLFLPAFASVPVKMPCGHVFCAGCLGTVVAKAWDDAPLDCPYHDLNLGIYRGIGVQRIHRVLWQAAVAAARSSRNQQTVQ